MNFPFWIQDGIFRTSRGNSPWCSVKMLLDPKIRESFGTLGLRLERIDETAPRVERLGLGSFTDCWLPIFLFQLQLPNVLINYSCKREFSLHFTLVKLSAFIQWLSFHFLIFLSLSHPIELNIFFIHFFIQFFLLAPDRFNFDFFKYYALFGNPFILFLFKSSITAL